MSVNKSHLEQKTKLRNSDIDAPMIKFTGSTVQLSKSHAIINTINETIKFFILFMYNVYKFEPKIHTKKLKTLWDKQFVKHINCTQTHIYRCKHLYINTLIYLYV